MRTMLWSVIAVGFAAAAALGATTLPSTQKANGSVKVDLPEGWEARTPTLKNVRQFAAYPALTAYFEVVAEPKTDFSDKVDLLAYAKLVKASTAKKTVLDNRQETDLKEGRIAGQATVEYEITGEFKGVKLRWRMIMVRAGDCFVKLACWTVPSHWDEAQAKFEALVGKLKVD